ncbi:MAG: hypothetical protein MZW92_09580 [Comamonadaceae bacterium]|nr:hypothetical protein [Comamonadaceae bacterium]
MWSCDSRAQSRRHRAGVSTLERSIRLACGRRLLRTHGHLRFDILVAAVRWSPWCWRGRVPLLQPAADAGLPGGRRADRPLRARRWIQDLAGAALPGRVRRGVPDVHRSAWSSPCRKLRSMRSASCSASAAAGAC